MMEEKKMVKELVVCEQISEVGCLCDVYQVGEAWSKTKPPTRLYAVFRASLGPDDCPNMPISPIIIEYKDPAEPDTAYREMLRWLPDQVYQGYLYLCWDVLPDQLNWGDWRAKFGQHVTKWRYVEGFVETYAYVTDTITGEPIVGAECTLEDVEGMPIAVAYTGADGKALFSETIKDVAYHICANAPGYAVSCIGIKGGGLWALSLPPTEPPEEPQEWVDYVLSINLKPWTSDTSNPMYPALEAMLSLANPFPFPFEFTDIVFLDPPPKIDVSYRLKHNPAISASLIAICATIAIAIVAAGYIIVSWNNTKIKTGEQEQQLYKYLPDFADELESLGFTPEQIAAIITTISAEQKADWMTYIIPVAAIAALAYIIASKPWK